MADGRFSEAFGGEKLASLKKNGTESSSQHRSTYVKICQHTFCIPLGDSVVILHMMLSPSPSHEERSARGGRGFLSGNIPLRKPNPLSDSLYAEFPCCCSRSSSHFFCCSRTYQATIHASTLNPTSGPVAIGPKTVYNSRHLAIYFPRIPCASV